MTHDDAYADARPLIDPRVPTRTKLSALWVAVMFLYVYVDIIGFYEPGTIDGILAGRVWTLDITPAWALGALVLMTVPILMLVLSLALPAAAARWANLVVAPLFVVVSLGNAIGETWLYFWVGAVVEAALLVLVVRYAWAWPRIDDRTAAPVGPPAYATSSSSRSRASMPSAAGRRGPIGAGVRWPKPTARPARPRIRGGCACRRSSLATTACGPHASDAPGPPRCAVAIALPPAPPTL